MNKDVDENRKLFWKEVSKVNGEKLEGCSRMKDGNGRLELGKYYLEDLHNIDTKEQVAFHTCSFDGIQRDNYLGGEPIKKTKVEVRLEKLKNRKATCKDEVTGLDLEAV